MRVQSASSSPPSSSPISYRYNGFGEKMQSDESMTECAMRELEPGTLRLNHGLPVKAYHGPSILESQEECGLVPDEPKFYSKGRLLVTRPDSSTRSQSSNDHSYITVEICLFICEGGRTSHRSEVTVFLLPSMARGGDKR